jgi:methyl-accepting chemotaxis protein
MTTLASTRIDSANSDSAAEESAAAIELAREVAACVPALPVLETQLRQAIQTVESSVVDVCSTFMSIAEQARQAVAAGEGQTSESSVGQLMASCSQAFDRLLAHIETSSRFVHSTADRMSQVADGMKNVVNLLDRVDNLARDVYVIALNGTIEAARAGEQGKAFAVVAEHTRQLATTARLTSEEIRGIVDQVAKQAGETASALAVQTVEDQRYVVASREEVTTAMSQLTSAHDQLAAAVAHSQSANAQLAANISKAVTTMQFQDAVAQRVGHVAETLTAIQSTLQHKLDDAAFVEPPGSHWLDRMSAKYVMQAERTAMSETTKTQTTSAAPASDLGDNIELF